METGLVRVLEVLTAFGHDLSSVNVPGSQTSKDLVSCSLTQSLKL